MKTEVTKLLGIEYPIIQGGMAWVAEHNLAAAVSEAEQAVEKAVGRGRSREKRTGAGSDSAKASESNGLCHGAASRRRDTGAVLAAGTGAEQGVSESTSEL